VLFIYLVVKCFFIETIDSISLRQRLNDFKFTFIYKAGLKSISIYSY